MAVVKTGSDVVLEAAHAMMLGSRVCPRVLGVWHRGVAYEYLSNTPACWTMMMVHHLLDEEVWRHPFESDMSWVGMFERRFRMSPPPSVMNEPFCLMHGDPTLANMRHLGGGVRLIDPKPPGRGIPSMRSVDLGKMLQSLMGWEWALLRSRGVRPEEQLVQQDWPLGNLSDDEMRRSVFWCMVHFLRICQREGRTSLGLWAQQAAIELEEYSA